MRYNEEIRDLFSVSDDYYLAHCISDDYAMGKGIATEFVKRYNMQEKLLEMRPYNPEFKITKGHCILEGKVLNLVTKSKYWHKPTYQTLENALRDMRACCGRNKVEKIAMPLIGCGLDKLKWNKVSEMIQDIFADTDIEILVCKR